MCPTAEERARRLAVGETNRQFNRRHIVNIFTNLEVKYSTPIRRNEAFDFSS